MAPPAAAPAENPQLAAYPLEWQRRLLAAQLAFAATLDQIDPIKTGGINQAQ
jgi:hypothetical protein